MRRAGSDIGERELLGEMFGKGMLGRNESLEIVVAILAAAGADARPFRIGGGGIVIADAGAGLIAIFREHIVEPGAELVLERAAAGGQIISRPFGALAVRAIRLRRLIGSPDFSRVRARRSSCARSSSGLRSSSSST